jgi:hypothetical protein
VTSEWRTRYDLPLRIIAGDEDYALGASFYSPDHPSYLTGFDARALRDFKSPDLLSSFSLSPWVNEQDITRDGLAIICSEAPRNSSTWCYESAIDWADVHSEQVGITVAKKLFGRSGPIHRFRVFFIPPKAFAD